MKLRRISSMQTGILLGITFLVISGSSRQVVSAAHQALDFPFSFLRQGTPEPFLYPPYYGEEAVSSIFDHEFPAYSGEAQLGGVITDMVHYHGTRLKGPGYSVHNGIDYALTYERVLGPVHSRLVAAGRQKCRAGIFALQVCASVG